MILTVTLNASVDKLYLVDRVTLNSVMRVKQVVNTAGGKGLNVSRVASAAGEEVLATGFLGGFSGEYIQSMLAHDGIESGFVKIGAETRSCINIADRITGRHTEFLEPGAEVTDAEQASFLEQYQKFLSICSVIVLSGSLPQGVPPDFYGKLISLAREQRKETILDTSGDTLKRGISFHPTLVKPNADEIRQLFDLPDVSVDSLRYAASKLHKQGIEVVVISRGKDGSLAACKEGIFLCNAPHVEAINTVGCGDSMVAGFAIGLAREYSFLDMIRFGVAASAANAATMATGNIRREDLERLKPLVEVERLGNI